MNYEQFLHLDKSNYDACYYKVSNQPMKFEGGGKKAGKGGANRAGGPRTDCKNLYGSERNIYYADFSEIIAKQPVIRSQSEETPLKPLATGRSNYRDARFCCVQPFWSPTCI